MIFILSGIIGISQEKETDPSEAVEEQIENQTETSETETEDDSFLQDLAHYRRYPINLNTAEASELRVLRLLSDLQIHHLLVYRNLLGPFISLYELQAVPSWDIAIIRTLVPYVFVGDTKNFQHHIRERLKDGDENLMFRFSMIVPKSKGFIKNDSAANIYLGSRPHLLIRYKYNFKNILQYGLIGEKDAGEQFLKGSQKQGFDFYSFHFFVRKLANVKSLAVGDFTVNLGQGLIHWQGFAFKKSTSIIPVKRQSEVLRPYTSSGEINFNRGAGITLVKGHWETTFYGSFRKLDAIINTDSALNNTSFITSLLNTGYHRTPGESEHRNNTRLASFGSNLKYNASHWDFGFNTAHYFFSNSMKPSGKPYDQFSIEGKSWSHYSLDYTYTFRNIHAFGEIAADKMLNIGLLSGFITSIDRSVDLAIVYRNISKRYQSIYGNAFTENILPVNEKGIYVGVTIRPLLQLKIDAYADFYKFPWLQFRTDAPGYGTEYVFQLTFIRGKHAEIYIRYKKESKQVNQSLNLFTTPIEFIPRRNLRYHLTYKFNREIVFKTRIEGSWYQHKSTLIETGYLAYIDIHYKHPAKPFSGYTRFQLFETDGYDSRIYAYENDLMFSFNSPAFFDKGFRWYLILRTNVSKWLFVRNSVKIQAEIKYALTHYFKLDKIGSELNEIQGNQRSDLKFQLLFSR